VRIRSQLSWATYEKILEVRIRSQQAVRRDLMMCANLWMDAMRGCLDVRKCSRLSWTTDEKMLDVRIRSHQARQDVMIR
jgi:hypothetical protein